MKKNTQNKIGIVALCLLLAVAITVSAVSVVKAFGVAPSVSFGDVANVSINVAEQGDVSLGGSTDDDWNVGGNLAVTGTTALTGAIAVSGEIQAARIVQGGTATASSTSKAMTLTAAKVCDYSVIPLSYTTAEESIAITLPATSTLAADCLNTVGDSVTFLFMNVTAAAASTTIVTTNTDYQLISDDANGDIIAGQDSAIITITRLATEMIAIVNPFTSAE